MLDSARLAIDGGEPVRKEFLHFHRASIGSEEEAEVVVGQPADMDAIGAIAAPRGIPVVEDAAHAVETVYRGRKVGSISKTTCFSFYATKNITTGEGGMLTTDDDALAERARVLCLHGISRDAWKRYSSEGFKLFEVLAAGFKYNMFDLQAALGLKQLDKVDAMHRARR